MRDVKCKKCANLKEGWCVRVLDNPDPDMVRTCSHFWEKTNGDMIRAMTDEELAIEMVGCPPGSNERCRLECECSQCWLGWLQQPVKEENHDL